MNKPLLLQVAKDILKNPDRYNQDCPCGTPCCIAGLALKRAARTIYLSIVRCAGTTGTRKYDWETEAKKIMGINARQFDLLCRNVYMGWPVKYAIAYENAPNAKAKAQAGHDRLMYFIKTGK